MADYDIPDSLLYTGDDEWIREEGETVFVGVTDFAQQQLGDVVYVELPAPGDAITQGDAFGVIESVKAVSDLLAPVSGKVVSINEELADAPEKVNEDCYGEGWMIEVTPNDMEDLDDLLDAPTYEKSVIKRSDD